MPAHAAVKDAITALTRVNTTVVPLMLAYRSYIRAAFVNATQELADFGMTPPKARAPRTAEQKATAAAKVRATRKARGTTSKKQKLAVHGDVTGVQITPVTDSANASPNPTHEMLPGSGDLFESIDRGHCAFD